MARYVPRMTIPVLFVGLLMITSGCSKPQKAPPSGKVSGSVTLAGEPVKEGCMVHFVAKGGNTGSGVNAGNGVGVVKADGSYVIVINGSREVPTGDYAIRILPPKDKAKEQEDQKQGLAVVMNAIGKNNPAAVVLPKSTQEDVVPRKYWSEGTSGLKFKVETGENTASFELSKDE